MSANPGTLRGTPGRGQGRGAMPFTNSPSTSAIPRPVLETSHVTPASEAGASSVSASRQKQSKRDEVWRIRSLLAVPQHLSLVLRAARHLQFAS